MSTTLSPADSSGAPRTAPRTPEELLAALDPDQREVAQHLSGPLCVLAGAGTGKTRAITYRIAHGAMVGAFQPTRVLAVTFTARAASEMRSRLRDLGVAGVQARTFHAAALRQLSYFWPRVVGGALPRIAEHKAPLVAEASGRLGLGADRLALRDLAAEIEWAKVSLVTAEDYPRAAARAGRVGAAGHDLTTVARLLSVYEDVKTDRGVIDFEDVLLLTVGVLAEREEIARTVREQYRHFVVDEYQDVSPLQQRLLDLWLGDRHELCVVGDVSQTIYSFTGASPRYLTGFASTHPGAVVVRLVRDYRSTPQVVRLANDVLARAGRDRSSAAVRLEAQRPSGPPVAYLTFDDDDAEAAGVARRIGELVAEGVPVREIAILYRTNAQGEAFEQALASAGIAYLVRGGERFFSRREVRDAMAMLAGAARSAGSAGPADDDAGPSDGFGDDGGGDGSSGGGGAAGGPAGSMPHQVRDVLSSAGWSASPPEGRGAVRERWESLDALVRLADDLHRQRGADLAGFVAELQERAAEQHAPAVEGVTLASLHAAKGLEWDAVFLAGVCEGLLPISFAEDEEEIAEERRLLYVGVTRAREHLTLSYARSRSAGGRGTRKPSRFLDGIWPVEEGRGGASERQRRKARAAAVQDALADADAEVFERLREWRGGLAKETGKPAYTILHDTTLVGIATMLPRTLRQLALVRGIGAAKIEAYGPAVLALVAGEDPPQPSE
ncbi:Rep family ATP-dependent DNA helicase [Salana multivorans]|uniref:DNA 3'-5' helicase n=1 Tax=Salana multivorans TaxID=120377 RepID=A0A3N2DCS6_9MICO|nr:ATP-dependent DNA helicase UvrD2 [Salana multivorans]ROR97522.1 Rep family ATP-dependent DNA helicase [Salana multivorans]